MGIISGPQVVVKHACEGCGVRLVVITAPPALLSPPPAIVSCWASASKPAAPPGRDLGAKGWCRVQYLVDVASEASQAALGLCKLFAFGIIAILAFQAS